MHRRHCLLGLIGLATGGSCLAALSSAAGAATPLLDAERALVALDRTEADYSFMIGRLTHRRRAGGWWRMRVARARAWGRRGRPGRH
jgi:hypothetical protein